MTQVSCLLKHRSIYCFQKLLDNICFRKINTSSFLLKKVSFKLSDIGEGIKEVTVKEWFVKVGDKVSQFDNLCEVQSDKASVTITSRYDGIVTKLYYDIDEIALVGKPLVDIENDEENHDTSENLISINEENPVQVQEEKINQNEIVDHHITVPDSNSIVTDQNDICIPSVRRLAKEHNIALNEIKGTGKKGRVLKEDILAYLERTTEVDKTLMKTTNSQIQITGFKKAMFKTMTESLKIPHFVYSDELKVTELNKLRKQLKKLPETEDIKITLMPFFVKAISNALQHHPIINSSLDRECENIILHKHHNIGIAMDTKLGLTVPVIKNIENKTIMGIAKELNELISRGRNGIFSPSDLSGATFTISNIGIIGGTYTKPVISPPQVAIIALGMSQKMPRFDDANNVVAEEIINISVSADHRIIDGVTMAKFIQIVKRQIEKPYLLFLNL